MKRMNVAVAVIALLCASYFSIYAQTTDIKPLKIGDKVPDIELKNVVNYPKTNVKLSDFRGKWIILDFWATWCAGCIASLS